MRTNLYWHGLIGGLLFWAVPGLVLGQVNSWTNTANGAHKWEDSTKWSLGVPPDSSQSSILITNIVGAIPRNKFVILDATTAGSFPATMTISNLNVWVPVGNLSQNFVLLENAGTVTPLRVLNSLTVSNRGILSVTNSVLLVGGTFATDEGAVTLNTGTIAITNSTTVVRGGMTVSDGRLLASNVYVGVNASTKGTLTLAGGISSFSATLTAGSFPGSTGNVWVTGGQLLLSNNIVVIGREGFGQMTISNGTVQASDTFVVAFSPGGRGLLNIHGGELQLVNGLLVSDDLGAHGSVLVTDGQLVVTNGLIRLGDFNSGLGELTVSNGTLLARDMILGGRVGTASKGVLTVAGGTNSLSSFLSVGSLVNATGSVFVSGGLLTVTNSDTIVGSNGIGQVTQSGGTTLFNNLVMGLNASARGSLTVSGGDSSVYSNLTIGNFPCAPTGWVVVAGGSLFVTNALGNATLEVRTGTLTLNSGTLRVDNFVWTNACSSFVRTGGTFIYGTAVLNPGDDADGDGLPNGWEQMFGLDPLDATGDNGAGGDPDGDGANNFTEYLNGTDPTFNELFRITAIAREGNNIRLTWIPPAGKTNALQRSPGAAGGSYSTSFTDIFTVTNTVGTTTNYLDIGAATNVPAYYYRVRLVP